MNAPAIVPRHAATRFGSSNSSQHSPFVDREEAEYLNGIGDRVAADRDVLERVIDLVNAASFEDTHRNRVRAKRVLLGALVDLAEVVQALSMPAPAFRKAARYEEYCRYTGTPFPCHDEVEESEPVGSES